ncbi:MAG: SGNH/GDSL hydrolase family protein [Bacteroidales bacterium]|nr:SGNH/GDSL hydrolase family protein [Bacteroidales bacterium]
MRKIIFLLMAFSCAMLSAQGTRVVFIGDSITDGNWGVVSNYEPTSAGRSQTDMNHIYGHGYVMLIASHYQSKYPRKGYEFFNRGISGHRLCDLAARWKEDVLDLHPDVLSVLIGTNDVHSYIYSGTAEPFDIEAWETTYRGLLQQVRKQNPSVKLVLCAPFSPLDQALTASLAAAVKELSREFGAVYVPFDSMFGKLLSRGDAPNYWIWDKIHPTPAGHRRMSELWMRKVRL